jgi:Tol biopolymer transport system component
VPASIGSIRRSAAEYNQFQTKKERCTHDTLRGYPAESTRPVDRPMMRLRVDLGPEAERDPRVSTLLSPDGRRLVFTGRASGGRNQLYTRRLDQPEATLLAGTESWDLEPFFSPDVEWIGFWAFDAKIKKVAAQGGSPMTLSEPISSVLGASWGDDNNIIFGTLGGLFQVPAAGGTPVKLLKEGHGPQIFPQVLPGSKAVLFNGFSGR